MAYYKKRGYKKRMYKKKTLPWYSKKYSPSQVAMQALKGVNYLKGLVNSELFINDTIGSVGPLYTNGTVTALTAIAQGDGQSGRTGNSIFVRGIDYNIDSIIHPSAVDTLVKWWIVIDMQQVGDTAPVLGDFLQTTGSANAPLSHLNSANLGRFKILACKMAQLDDSSRQQQFQSGHIDLRHHVRYNGTASTDIQKGGIYFITVSNQNTNNPTIYCNIRVRYHDN